MSNKFRSAVQGKQIDVPEGVVIALEIIVKHRDSEGANLIQLEESVMDRIAEDLSEKEPNTDFDTVSDYRIRDGDSALTYKLPYSGIRRYDIENTMLPRIEKVVGTHSDNQYGIDEWEIRVAEGEEIKS